MPGTVWGWGSPSLTPQEGSRAPQQEPGRFPGLLPTEAQAQQWEERPRPQPGTWRPLGTCLGDSLAHGALRERTSESSSSQHPLALSAEAQGPRVGSVSPSHARPSVHPRAASMGPGTLPRCFPAQPSASGEQGLCGCSASRAPLRPSWGSSNLPPEQRASPLPPPPAPPPAKGPASTSQGEGEDSGSLGANPGPGQLGREAWAGRGYLSQQLWGRQPFHAAPPTPAPSMARGSPRQRVQEARLS